MDKKALLLDNDDRRLENDRRIFSYAAYFPERRSNENRRYRIDRRYKQR